eukprot:CCRYP_016166-RA/>CCRYP_016166-RA protein AED:0.26 eAED:0.31 QI:0/0/0/1/0/0/2/0/84
MSCKLHEAEFLNHIKIFRTMVHQLNYPEVLGHQTLVPYDIQTVWNCKTNSLNATLWARSFMFPTFGDIKNLVVKWLVCYWWPTC